MHKILSIALAVCLSQSNATAETLLQQDKLSLEKCINVIEITSENLKVEPDIVEDSSSKRVAEYQLVDGVLKIECDGDLGNIKVISK